MASRIKRLVMIGLVALALASGGVAVAEEDAEAYYGSWHYCVGCDD